IVPLCACEHHVIFKEFGCFVVERIDVMKYKGRQVVDQTTSRFPENSIVAKFINGEFGEIFNFKCITESRRARKQSVIIVRVILPMPQKICTRGINEKQKCF